MHTYTTFTMASACDGLELSVMLMKPKGRIEAIVQLAHGMAEHKERYLKFMDFLAEHGIMSVIMDHRGHGASVRSKEDLGYFYDDSGRYIVEDAHQLTLLIKQDYPKLPYVLFGHSMGSLVVRAYSKCYDKDIDGLIVCGSPSKNALAPLALRFVKLLEKVKSDHYRSKLVQHLTFSAYEKRFINEGSRNAWLSANQENVKRYDACELCGFSFTLNGFQNLFLLMTEVYERAGWKCLNKDLPIVFLAGSDDPCIVNEEKFCQAYTFLQDIGYTNIEHKLFDKLRHEILFERDADMVYEYIYDWIIEKVLKKHN